MSCPYMPSGIVYAAILFSLHALPIAGDIRRCEAMRVSIMPSSFTLERPQPSSIKSPGATPETMVSAFGEPFSRKLLPMASKMVSGEEKAPKPLTPSVMPSCMSSTASAADITLANLILLF